MVNVTLPSACNFPSWTHKSQNRWVSGAIRKEGPKLGFSGPGISLIWSSGFGISLVLSSGFGIWKQNRGEFGVLKVFLGGGMPKISLGITGLHEIFGRDYGIEVSYWGSDLRSAEVTRAEKERKLPQLKRNVQYFYQNWIYKCPTVPFGMYGSQIRLVWSRHGYFGDLNFPEMLPNKSIHNTYGTKLTSFKTVSPIR